MPPHQPVENSQQHQHDAPLKDPWFRLGTWSFGRHRDVRGVEQAIERQSLLIPPDGFATIYDRLNAIGNTLNNLGQPTASVLHTGDNEEYRYSAFHDFHLSFGLLAEPLVFFYPGNASI